MLIDSHCHLVSEKFEADLPEIIARAHSNGVGVMLSVCTKASDYEKTKVILSKYQNIFCTVGIHSSEASGYVDAKDEKSLLAWISDCGKDNKTVAVGEVGLDYSYEDVDWNLQKWLFNVQIRASIDAGLPLVIHTREAEEDTMEILKSHNLKNGGVIHCFAGSEWLMRQALDLGFYISFSGIVTFERNNLRWLVNKIPIERILLETDAPFLAPEPVRGKRNEPAYVKHIALLVAELKNVDYETLMSKTTDNFYSLFKKAQNVRRNND